MMRTILVLVFSVVAASLFEGCTGLRAVTKEDPMYTGPIIKVEGDLSRTRKKELKKSISSGLRPKPNQTFLGFMRTRVAIYHFARDAKPETKGIKRWLKYHVGEPPVRLSDIDRPHSENLIKDYLIDNGHFKPVVKSETKKRRKTGKVVYTITPGVEYKIASVTFPKADSVIHRAIASKELTSVVKPGQGYRLSTLRAERLRIDSALKTEGFFFFQPDYILFTADTTAPDNSVKLSLGVKHDVPTDAERKMFIDKIIVNTDFTFEGDTAMLSMDTVFSEGIYVLVRKHNIQTAPHVISRSVAFKAGREYSRKDHDKTLARLTALGLFKFVNVTFSEVDTAVLNNKLVCRINLTPLDERSIRLELQGVTKSNNFAGPVVSLAFRDRNLFHHAELFQFNINTSFQTQVRRRAQPLNAFELSTDAYLFIPRIVAPFVKINPNRQFTPRTRIGLGAGVFNRVDFYSLNSFFTNYGYLWKESETKSHELNPISINYLNITNKTARFEELLEKNLLLRNSFQEQFIIGSNYIYTYQNLTPKKPSNFFYLANIDLSGNSLYLLEKAIGKDPLSFTGIPYSQYARIENDGRFYYDLTRNLKFASRFIAGVGVPFGKSDQLPYIKQFFAGGANSIRAFAPRSVGPGSFIPTTEADLAYFEQGGEMRLEGSVELRYSLTNIIKPAIFFDAGNVWLLNKRPEIPGGEFGSGFMNQVAMGAGFGVRVDISILVLRFDLAFPLNTPYTVPSTFQDDDVVRLPGSFGRNYVLNIALGYPF